MRRTNYGWPQRAICGMLRGRAIEAQTGLDAAKRLLNDAPEYKYLHDFYLAQFYVLNLLWMNDRAMRSRQHVLKALRWLLQEPDDPAEDAHEPGMYATYRELCLKSLILEFESLLYR